MSFRSKFSFPANKIANDYFNGGGHLNAAGGHSNLPMEDAIKQFEDVLKEYKTDFNNVAKIGMV
jgi:phosphoesterase RecJ-like protein